MLLLGHDMSAIFPAFAAVAGASVFLYWALGLGRRSLPLPPGPKPRFIYGNTSDIPHEKPWVEFHNWGKRYGKYPSLDCDLLIHSHLTLVE